MNSKRKSRTLLLLHLVYGNERGIVLPVALMLLAVLAVIGAVAAATTRTDVKIAGNWKNHTQAFYMAEAGIESGVVDLKALLATASAPTVAQLTAISPPVLSDPDFSFNVFQLQQVNSYSTVVSSGPYQGLNASATDYQITSEVNGPQGSRSRLTQIVRYLEIPLSLFGVFYGEGVDLEIAPGPPMIFNGRVHANSNIYVRNSSTKFDSFMTTTGNLYRYIKRDPPTWGSNPQIKDANGVYQTVNFDHEYDYNFSNPWSEADWKSAALSTFGGRLLDSAHDVETIVPPIPDLFYNPANPDLVSHQLIEKGDAADTPAMQQVKLYYQADLRIENGTVKDKSGNAVDMSSCDPNALTTKSFYDKREQADVTVTEIDIGLLMACDKAPANGIAYAYSDGASKGIRLVNGSQLPSQGFTVVSENPVYVQGDYNTVNKVPAAVMGDAVTVLSNNWGPNNSDNKGDQETSKRPATDTTVNAAFMTGPSAESVVGQGNGQLENVIRFLEKWSGDTFIYRGSIIALWHSQQATGPWRCCGDSGNNYYNPPNRDWGYDTLFDTSTPPGFPKGVIMARGPWAEV